MAPLDPGFVVDEYVAAIRSGRLDSPFPQPCHGPYVRGVAAPEVQGSLLGEYNTQKARDYLVYAGKVDFLSEGKIYESLVDNGRFRPHEAYQLADHYVATETFSKLDCVLTFITHPKLRRHVALVGPKGSGKTITQNCWLYRRNHDLEQQNTLWIRSDCHRLYDIWTSATQQDPASLWLLPLETYLDIQLVYVFCKNRRKSRARLIARLFDEMPAGLRYDEPSGRHDEKSVQTRYLRSRVEEVGDQIAATEKSARLANKAYRYVDELVALSQRNNRRELRRWLALATALYGYLERKGVTVLQIVDGVDNIHITRDTQKHLYRNMIQQTAKFLNTTPGERRQRLAAFRQRTFSDCLQEMDIAAGRSTQMETHQITMVPAEAGPVQRSRLDLFQNVADRPDAPMSDDRDIFLKILKEVCDLASEEPPGRYHHNHRDFLHNRLTLVRHVYYRLLQLNRGFSIERIRAQVRKFSTRNLLLNGRFFIDSEKDWNQIDQEIGTLAFNTFYTSAPEIASSTALWPGLRRTRVLQALQLTGPIEQTALVNALKQFWHYAPEHLDDDICKFRGFGMVDTTLSAKDNVIVESNVSGRAMLAMSFTDIDILYYCALDAALPEWLFESGLIRGHENRFGMRTGYPVASVLASLAFLRFLSSVAAREAAAFRELGGAPPWMAGLIPLPHQTSEGRVALARSLDAQCGGMDPGERVELAEAADKLFSAATMAPDEPEDYRAA